MFQCVDNHGLAEAPAKFETAFVVDAPSDDGFFQLCVSGRSFEEWVLARSVLSPGAQAEKDDQVLIVSDDAGNYYIIGIVKKSSAAFLEVNKKLVAEDGTCVVLKRGETSESIEVRSKSGDILFEYDPAKGRFSFRSPCSDLVFSAPFGNIDMLAKKNIRFSSEGDLLFSGLSNIKMLTGGTGLKNSSFLLNKDHTVLKGKRISVTADEAECDLLKTKLRGKMLSAKIDKAWASFESLEIVSQSIKQKTKDLYQRVEHLFQIDAGRMRMLIWKVFNLKGGRTYINADKDLKLKGEKIHLR